MSGAFDAVVEVVGLLFALFYAVTGVATAWLYRRVAARSLAAALTIGAMPLAGAAVLLYIAVRSMTELESGSAIGLLILAALGLLLLAFARFVERAPFFSMPRAVIDPDSEKLLNS